MKTWRILRTVLWYVCSVLLVGFIVGLAAGIVSYRIQGKETETALEFLQWMRWNWQWILAVLWTFLVFVVYVRIKSVLWDFSAGWEIAKLSGELTADDFRIQKYFPSYIPRKGNSEILDARMNGGNVLIIGKPKIGKTRAAYEAIKNHPNCIVLKPRSERIDVNKLKRPMLLKSSDVILFLDDIDNLLESDLALMVDRLQRSFKRLTVVATCRSGEELLEVQQEAMPLFRELRIVELGEISEEEGKTLADEIGAKWHKNQFDGTPGSITLDLQDMTLRYREIGEAKVILKALKLLHGGGLTLNDARRVMRICSDVFQFPPEKLKLYYWQELINQLKSNGFISFDNSYVAIYSAYLDVCVTDYDVNPDIPRLHHSLVDSKDSVGLLHLSRAFYRKGEYRFAENCCREALEIFPAYLNARTSLGFVLSKIAEHHEVVGDIKRAKSLYEESISQYRKVLLAQPKNGIIRANMGFSLNRLGQLHRRENDKNLAESRFAEALQELQAASKLNPGFKAVHRFLAVTLSNLGRDDDASHEFALAVALEPGSPHGHNLYGRFLAEHSNPKDAEAQFKEAIKLKEDFPSAWNNCGHLLMGLNRSKEAEECFKTAIRFNDSYALAYTNLGHLYCRIGSYGKAVEVLRKALVINPDYVEARNALGFALLGLDKVNESEAELQKALELSPSDADVLVNLGYCKCAKADVEKSEGREQASTGLYTEAENLYNKALRLTPQDVKTRLCLAVVLERQGKDESADKLYNDLLKEHPDDEKVKRTYAYFLRSRNQLSKVRALWPDPSSGDLRSIILGVDVSSATEADHFIEKFREALIQNPTDAKLRTRYGRALAKLDRLTEAQQALELALKQDPDDPECNKSLGVVYEKMARAEKNASRRKKMLWLAAERFERAIHLNSKYAAAHRHLARTMMMMGNQSAAQSEYEEGQRVGRGEYPKNTWDFALFLKAIGKPKEAKVQAGRAIVEWRKLHRPDEARRIEEEIKGWQG